MNPSPRKPGHKKVLFVVQIGEFHGGGERSGFEFCKFLEKNGHDVITAIPKSSKTYRKELEKSNMKYHLLNCSDFEAQVMSNNPAFMRVVSELVEIIKNEKIDLVITNLYAQCGPVAAVLSGVPNISMDRGQAYFGAHYSNFMAKISDAIIVNSMGLVDIYRETYDINTPIVYSYTARPNVGLSQDVKEQRIVCVSRISPEKNLIEALRALKILKRRGIFEGKILFIGPAPGTSEKMYVQELHNYAAENDIASSVEWLGGQKDPWSLVGENDIYLNTSDKESVGRSNIEAIKLGIPAILADIPGHRDIFEKIGAIKYEHGHPEDLSEKIEYVIKNYPKIKNNSKKSKAKAEEIINEYDCNKEVLPLLEAVGSASRIKVNDLIGYLLNMIDESGQVIGNLSNEITQRNAEIESHMRIKRSARLLAGNIKRKIGRYAKRSSGS